MKTNVLYYSDNLNILRNPEHFPDNSIDLIYLDPPFSSKKDYNIIFHEPSGKEPEVQIRVFKDIWHWDRAAEDTLRDIVLNAPPKVAKLIETMCNSIGRNDITAYLVMMTIRLVELHRVLKDTGSLYLHCDPTASHYLKVVLDQVFGARNFRNEIVWCYRGGGVSKSHFARKHDTILFYSKSSAKSRVFNIQYVPYSEASQELVASRGGVSIDGKVRDLERGAHMPDWWTEVISLQTWSPERLGYPTQKPEALLERIIKASSNEGDVVLDPFCGCGTALVAAHKLNRKWIGIDITYLAINVTKKRLYDSFGFKAGIDYEVIGEPKDFASACELARQDYYQFQWWALSLIGAKSLGEKRKGADKGIDGVISFIDDHGDKAKRAVIQVKSDHTGVKDIRELKSIVEQNAMGIFITLISPTREMKAEAVVAGYYHSPLYNKDYPKIQILTIEELLQGKKVDMPPISLGLIPKALRISKKERGLPTADGYSGRSSRINNMQHLGD